MGFGPVMIVAPPADMPGLRKIPGAEKRPCATCKRPVIVTPATLARLDMRHPESTVSCIACADLVGLELRAPTPEQRAELVAAGHGSRFAMDDVVGKVLTEEHQARVRALAAGAPPANYFPAKGGIKMPSNPEKAPLESKPPEFAPKVEILTPVEGRGRQAEIARRNQKEK